MQKYRRWTDQATGINPFTTPTSKTFKLSNLIILAILTVVKINIISLFILPILSSLLLQNLAVKNKILGQIIGLPLKFVNILLGLWGVDDGNFRNYLQRNSKGKLILSNSVSILDAFYYMSIIPGVRFVVSNPQQSKFQLTYGIGAILRILSNKQPFFNLQASQNSQNLKSLISRQIANGYTCILFYQGIRTNGLGTIKISKKLSAELYNLQKNYCIVHMKYPSAPQSLFSVVSTPAVLFLMALGNFSISLRVRCNPIAISTQHSQDDVQKDIDNFLMANAAKLLDTNPADYFTFYDFYTKSQQSGYTQLSTQQEKMKEK